LKVSGAVGMVWLWESMVASSSSVVHLDTHVTGL
jgi:hypothetical protein